MPTMMRATFKLVSLEGRPMDKAVHMLTCHRAVGE